MLPYVDATTFIEAPTGIDTSQLVPSGTSPQQSAELQNILERATSWIDSYCYQRLAATTDSEIKRVRPNLQGQLEIYPKQFPIISVISAQWIDLAAGASAVWTPITVTDILALERSFLVYDTDYSYWRGWGTFPLQVQYEYTNGYPHTTLTGPAGTTTIVPEGSATIQVASTIGIGTTTGAPENWNLSSQLTILDGANREIVTVTSISGTTLTLAAPTVNTHSVGALVTAVPPIIQDACIQLAAWRIKTRGDASFVMSGSGVSGSEKPGKAAADETIAAVMKSLQPFRRVL